MKKRNMIAALLCSACLVAGSVNPVFADASKVVTLGADLREYQLCYIVTSYSHICGCNQGCNTWSRSFRCPETDNDEIF